MTAVSGDTITVDPDYVVDDLDSGGAVDILVAALGTGGTIAGVGMALKERSKDVKVVMADPYGSCMYTWFKTGELKSEGSSISAK